MEKDDFGPFACKGLNRAQLTDNDVLRAMSKVPRHQFVPEAVQNSAYEDRALPIGFGQTISQPFIVALMVQEAHITPGCKVLEIGTGSGYQAAVLAELGARVYTVEFVPGLATRAEEVLRELSKDRVSVRCGDGWKGWPEEAPFDAIIVAAASPSVPPELCRQLAEGGRLILPIELEDEDGERLTLIERHGEEFLHNDLGAVRFVPLRGKARNEGELESSHAKTIH